MIKQPQMVRRSNLLFRNMGFHQIINEVTLVLEKPLSYIDLIFTSQTNMVVDSGVHASLHPNCQHQIPYAKFNLKIHFLPTYEQEKRHYR